MNRYTAAFFVLLLTIFAVLPAHGQDSGDTEYAGFDGIWETDLGTIALWQTGDTIWGIWSSNGEIGGKVDEYRVFTYNYDDGSYDMGGGRWTLSEDGRSFNGRYQSTMDEQEHGQWNGVRLGPNQFEIGDRDALNYTPGNLPPELAGSDEDDSSGDTVTSADTDTPDDTDTAESPAVASNAWTGTWETNLGFLVTAATGNEVIGSFGENGVLEGTISGNNLSATWSMTQDGTALTGEAFFTINADGTSYRGNYLVDGDDIWLAWNGSKTVRTDEDEDFSFNADESEELEPVETAHTDTPVEISGDDLLNSEELGPEIDETVIEETETEEPVIEEPVDTTPPELEPDPEPAVEPEEDTNTLKLTARAECWVTVRNEDGRLFTGAMAEGDVLEYEDPVGFYVRAGRPEMLDVEFNGELMEWEEFSFAMNLPLGTIIYEPPTEED